MIKLFDRYKKILTDLLEIMNDISKLNKLLDSNLQDINKEKEDLKEFCDMELLEIKSNMAKIKAFVDIAKTHTAKLIEPYGISPVDMGKLSRLSVMINSGKSGDPYAAALYTEAMGQMKNLECDECVTKKYLKVELDKLEEKLKNKNNEMISLIEKKEEEYLSYILDEKFAFFILEAKKVNDISCFKGEKPDFFNEFSLGNVRYPFPVPSGLENMVQALSAGFYDIVNNTMEIPLCFDPLNGGVIISEYENETESLALEGVQNILLNIYEYFGDNYEKGIFIDPIRLNLSALGAVSSLNDFMEKHPFSVDDIRKKLRNTISKLNMEETYKAKNPKSMVLVFHSFPENYDSGMISLIKQICANADRFGLTVVLTHNKSAKTYANWEDVLSFLKTFSFYISSEKNGFKYNGYDFNWLLAPKTLPESIKLNSKTTLTDLGNDYESRIGLDKIPDYNKGFRKLTNIPYGLDDKGEIRTFDFEDGNFSTFICGATRSGKSTLLHTIITGLIKNNHPDDIELWLIDFKKTEFSRYINHLPAHVRYIVLDESPELVYDIIDRLTEIMKKRENIFKGKWLKLDDVPISRYMPSIMVIIDEFSIMSGIISDSYLSSDNYAMKLQALLGLGAGLGIKFIFSSQGFTSGTRGLNDFAKKQIQQRVAMKTEYMEIKETLNLKSASDEDKALMEELMPYHTLTRIPQDDRGNHLLLCETLYIKNYENQEKLIDNINKSLTPVNKFAPDDVSSYIYKNSLVVDGNSFSSYESKNEDIKNYLKENARENEYYFFLGEAKRLLPLFPVTFCDEFSENMIISSSGRENEAVSSIILSMRESLRLQKGRLKIWSLRKDAVYNKVSSLCDSETDLMKIAEEISEIKRNIYNKKQGCNFYVILDAYSMLTEMRFEKETAKSDFIERRGEEKLDLNTKLELALKGEYIEPINDRKAKSPKFETDDIFEDLKFVLTNGPKLGYHFIFKLDSLKSISQLKLDTFLFKHKILFRAAKVDALNVTDTGNAQIISEMPDRTFRYTDGLINLSFKPYLHDGLSWDGWSIKEGKVFNSWDEEEEYLL